MDFENFEKILIGPNFYSNPVFIYGQSISENISLIEDIFHTRNINYSKIDCCEIFKMSYLAHSLKRALRELGFKLVLSSNFSFQNLIKYLKNSNLNCSNKKVIIFEDFNELFSNLHLSQIISLFKLNEMINSNIFFIFTSNLPLEGLENITGFVSPICIHFQYPTLKKITNYLCNRLADTVSLDETSLAVYIENFLNTYYSYHYNLKDLLFKSKSLLNQLEDNNSQSVTIVKEKSNDLFRKNILNDDSSKISNNADRHAEKLLKMSLNGVPKCLKYVCLAAYLASCIPKEKDANTFANFSKKTSRTKRKNDKKNDETNESDYSRSFNLERIIGIFRSISNKDHAPICHIEHCLSTAVSLSWISLLNISDIRRSYLNQPKYKFNLPEEFITEIAKELDVDINKYKCHIT